MAASNIIEQLDTLYAMVTDAWGVPLGNDKCIIERDKAIQIITDIKNNLPSAIAESKRLVAARDEFIGNAKREAEALRKNAEEMARSMVEQQEVMRVARARSAEMIATAEARSRELQRVAGDYTDDVMRQTEESLASALEIVRAKRSAFARIEAQPKKTPPAPRMASPIVPEIED